MLQSGSTTKHIVVIQIIHSLDPDADEITLKCPSGIKIQEVKTELQQKVYGGYRKDELVIISSQTNDLLEETEVITESCQLYLQCEQKIPDIKWDFDSVLVTDGLYTLSGEHQKTATFESTTTVHTKPTNEQLNIAHEHVLSLTQEHWVNIPTQQVMDTIPMHVDSFHTFLQLIKTGTPKQYCIDIYESYFYKLCELGWTNVYGGWGLINNWEHNLKIYGPPLISGVHTISVIMQGNGNSSIGLTEADNKDDTTSAFDYSTSDPIPSYFGWLIHKDMRPWDTEDNNYDASQFFLQNGEILTIQVHFEKSEIRVWVNGKHIHTNTAYLMHPDRSDKLQWYVSCEKVGDSVTIVNTPEEIERAFVD